MRLVLVSLCCFLAACESGLSRSVKLTIPAAVAARFTADQPGIVVADLGSRAQAFTVLCGQGLKNPVWLTQDLGFGCLGARNATEETIRVWVDPTRFVDAGVSCSTQREFYEALGLTSADGGALIAIEPDATWTQGTATATWRRDGSPCGGVLNAELTF